MKFYFALLCWHSLHYSIAGPRLYYYLLTGHLPSQEQRPEVLIFEDNKVTPPDLLIGEDDFTLCTCQLVKAA